MGFTRGGHRLQARQAGQITYEPEFGEASASDAEGGDRNALQCGALFREMAKPFLKAAVGRYVKTQNAASYTRHDRPGRTRGSLPQAIDLPGNTAEIRIAKGAVGVSLSDAMRRGHQRSDGREPAARLSRRC